MILSYSEIQTLQIHIFNNVEDDGFQVIGVGTVGVTTTARVDLSVTSNTPEDLFYKLTPVNLGINAPTKRNPIVDTDVINYSSLKVSDLSLIHI